MSKALILLAFLPLFLLALFLLRQEPEPVEAERSPLLLEVETLARQMKIKKVEARGQQKAPVTKSWALLLRRAQEEGWRGRLQGPISGIRTWQEQNYLYRAFLSGVGAPAFSPDGPSRHMKRNISRQGEWAQAVDASRAWELVAIANEKLDVPLYLPYKDEPWHVEARSPFSLQSPDRPAAPVERAGLSPTLWLLLLPALVASVFYRRWPLVTIPLLAALALLWQSPLGGALLLILLAFSLPFLFCAKRKGALS